MSERRPIDVLSDETVKLVRCLRDELARWLPRFVTTTNDWRLVIDRDAAELTVVFGINPRESAEGSDQESFLRPGVLGLGDGE